MIIIPPSWECAPRLVAWEQQLAGLTANPFELASQTPGEAGQRRQELRSYA